MTTATTTTRTGAHVVDAVKVYGGGDTAVRALAGNWITDPKLNPYQLAEGRAPSKSGEVVVNRVTAKKGGLSIGDTTTLRTPDPVKVTIVGLATFAGEDGMAQVTFTGMTQADAQRSSRRPLSP